MRQPPLSRLSGIAPALTRFIGRIAGESGGDVCQDVLLTIAVALATFISRHTLRVLRSVELLRAERQT